MNENFLRIPLYKLYYIDNVIDYSGFTEKDLESLISEYDESELKKIAESVRWATQNQDYDFASLLPNLKQSNDEIFEYLCELDDFLEKNLRFLDEQPQEL